MSDGSQVSRGMPSLWTSIRHHLWALLLITALVLGLGAAYLATKSESYTSTASILLSPAPGNPLTVDTASGSTIQLTVAMQTEAELVRAPTIREMVADTLGRVAPQETEVLSVTVPSNTQMLDISFTSDDPQVAQEAADAFAQGYLDYRAGRAEQNQESRISALQEQLAEADESLRRAAADAAEAGALSYASREVDLLVDRIARLSNNLSLAESVSTSPGSVLNPAEVPERSDGLPNVVLLLALGFMGLLFGVLATMLLEWRRDLIRDSDEPENLGVPVFASIAGPAGTSALAPDADEAAHEAFRQLRAGVIANGARPHVLAVTALDLDGSAAVATNVAIVLAEARFSVLLVAADPRDHGVEDLLGLEPRRGLSEAVRSMAPVREVLVEERGVHVLTTGLEPFWVSDLGAGPEFRALVQEWRSEFDYVVLSAAPTGTADGDAVVSVADSVLLVLRAQTTTRARLLAALERFRRLRIDTMGAVKVSGRGRPSGRKTRDRDAIPVGLPTTRQSRVSVREHAS